MLCSISGRPGIGSALARAAVLLLCCAALSGQAQPVAPVSRLAAPPVTAAALAPAAEPTAAAAPAPLAAPVTQQTPRGSSLQPDLLRELSEFERLATDANGGRRVLRLGADARPPQPPPLVADTPARVPADYRVQVGDEVTVSLWGSVDGHWPLRVDRAGRLTLPRVGPVAVAGSTAAELPSLLRRRFDTVFKGHELAAAVTELSPLRVHITGFVERPGDYLVPGLTTVSSALALAQGPSGAGSWRRITLLRDDRPLAAFDHYNLLRTGSRRDDRLLQPGDVLHVDALGPQVAVLGSVNRPTVLELLPAETVADALRLAGGLSSVADRSLLTLERLGQRHGLGAEELVLPRDLALALKDGDILRARSLVLADGPTQLRNKRVRVGGEVRKPGDYLLPASATLADAVVAAGGATPSAFVFGTALRRESVRVLQEANYERALRELEADLLSAPGRRLSATAAQPADDAQAVRQLLNRLRERKPEGRVVLEISPQAEAPPATELEDGDQVHLPPRNQSVGVFGSVYNTGSFLHVPGRSVADYLQRAGGPREGAQASAAFVVRANGAVLSATQGQRWQHWPWRGSGFDAEPALPGDTVFVPDDIFRVGLVQGAKDWTQVLYQLGVGLAALLTIR